METIVDINEIANRIKAKLGKMNQKEFSLKMEHGENWLAQLGNSQTDMKVSDLVKACEMLDISPCYILSFNPRTHLCNVSIEKVMKIFIKRELDLHYATHKEKMR